MALMKNEEEEPTLPAKRKSDLVAEGIDIDANESTTKKQKSEKENNSSVPEEKKVINEEENEEDEENYEGHNDDVEEEEESDDEEVSNGEEEAQIDRKGKGIMKDDKGKGKLIEESDELSDDDDDGDEEEDSDLSDDPLAEVDLDNILPSRTRRGVARPGLSIGNDLVPRDNNGNDV